jgi:hypothetical protein
MKEVPPKIFHAIKSGDTEYLRNAGRKGGHKTAERHQEESAHEMLTSEIRELEEWQRKLSTNEHIIDPDGIDQNYLNDED